MYCKTECFVNAIQWTGHNKDEILNFCGKDLADVLWDSYKDEYVLYLNTKPDSLYVSHGSYVIRYPGGGVWAMLESEFEKSRLNKTTDHATPCEDTSKCEAISVEPSWQERMQGEYHDLKTRYEKLHRMVTKYEAGTLDFTPNCSLDLLRQQKRHMGEYLHDLEIRAEVEGIEL